MTVWSSSMKDYTCHYAVCTYKTNVCINFIKINVNLKFLFTRNQVVKHKGVVSNLHVFVMASGKCELRTYFTFLQRILTSTHMKKYNFFYIIYVTKSNIHFSVSIMAKWLAKHISTKVSFKITTTKKHVHIDIRWTWKWNQ